MLALSLEPVIVQPRSILLRSYSLLTWFGHFHGSVWYSYDHFESDSSKLNASVWRLVEIFHLPVGLERTCYLSARLECSCKVGRLFYQLHKKLTSSLPSKQCYGRILLNSRVQMEACVFNLALAADFINIKTCQTKKIK